MKIYAEFNHKRLKVSGDRDNVLVEAGQISLPSINSRADIIKSWHSAVPLDRYPFTTGRVLVLVNRINNDQWSAGFEPDNIPDTKSIYRVAIYHIIHQHGSHCRQSAHDIWYFHRKWMPSSSIFRSL